MLSLLVFPGLLFVLVLGIGLHAMIHGVPRLNGVRLPRIGFESTVALASILLAALGSALLPWPGRPVGGIGPLNGPIAALLAIQGAFLLALLPGLLNANALTNRATIREAQIGTAGQVVLWVVLGTLLWQNGPWVVAQVPGRLLLAAAGILAVPAAIGVGPFAADRTLALSAAEYGLDKATAGFVQLARSVRGGVVLGAALLVLVPQGQVRPALAFVIWAALVLVVALVLRRLNGRTPRLALPNALRWCWWRALPLAAVGLIYLAVVT